MSSRERAWTAEQVEYEASELAMYVDASLRRPIDMLHAYAATLSQQAEQAGGVVSDEACAMLRRKLPLGCAGMVGNDEARAALEAVAPLLRAPGGQDGRVDEAMVERARKAYSDAREAGRAYCNKCGGTGRERDNYTECSACEGAKFVWIKDKPDPMHAALTTSPAPDKEGM